MADFELVLAKELNTKIDGLPKDFNVQRFCHNASAFLKGNDNLAKWINEDQGNRIMQVKEGMIKSAFLGLDAMSSEVYLIPNKGNLQTRISYTGAIKLAKKYSIRPIKDIYAKVVREGDEFKEKIINSEPCVDFYPRPFSDGAIVGVFAVCLYADGGALVETMSKEEIDKCRSKSSASNSMAWRDFYQEMAKKSCVHRLSKWLELDFENPNQKQLFMDDMALEMDAERQAANDISENANTEVFDTSFEE